MAHNQEKLKALFLENLAKIPIISLVCEKIGISRATYYRWINTDEDFWENIEIVLSVGRDVINDLCESKVVGKIQEGDNKMIIYWLSHNSKRYSPYAPTYREKKIMQMPLVKFKGADGVEYDSFAEYSKAEMERVKNIIESA